MFRQPALLITLILFTSCQQSRPPTPVVSTDTQSDLLHDHRHSHGDQHRHDHTHQDGFEGAHVHPHVHGHRHAPLLHGGIALSLQRVLSQNHPTQTLGRQQAVPSGAETQAVDLKGSGDSLPDFPHLEMVLDSPTKLSIHCLSETPDGTWDSWQIGTQVVTLAFIVDHSQSVLKLERAKDSDAFSALLPEKIQQAIEVKNSAITLRDIDFIVNGHVFRVRESILIRNGELDAFVE